MKKTYWNFHFHKNQLLIFVTPVFKRGLDKNVPSTQGGGGLEGKADVQTVVL